MHRAYFNEIIVSPQYLDAQPPARAAVIRQVQARDREYFVQHTETKQYLRPYVPGEVWPYAGTHPAVLVGRFRFGIRARMVVCGNDVVLGIDQDGQS